MRFSLRWLSEYVDFDLPPEGLAERLTMAGLEVEELTYRGREIEDIVVARIAGMRPHPGADRLSLCDVTDGEETVQVVSGATNMKEGDRVALARVGTELPETAKYPDGLRIKKTKIRGEVSMGMLCAEDELGLGEEGEGIMILPRDAPVGERVVDVLGLGDVVMEVGVTPNRPDCLGVVGVAREVAAILGVEHRYPPTAVVEGQEAIGDMAAVCVEDAEGCPRYTCRVIRGVAIGPSPGWLVHRLEASGMRSINSVVDVTNYVLLELGQPLHAFDYDSLEGGRIVVRSASEGEKIRTLDGIERTLTEEDLLICDAARPVALAGVMGGAETEVSGLTANVLLESAYFNPTRVRRTSKRANLRSESSYRFERGVDPEGVVRALDRAAELIRELAGGEVARGRIDVYPKPFSRREVALSLARVASLIGTDIHRDDVERHLSALGMDVRGESGEVLTVGVPTWRVDLEREVDLIEELTRLHGYDSVPATLPNALMVTKGVSRVKALERRVRDILISAGFLESINYSFEDPGGLSLWSEEEPISILNPLTAESSAMRTNLIAGLMKNLRMNLYRQEEDLRIFEAGRCFYRGGENGAPHREVVKLAGVVRARRGVELWESEEFDFSDLKGILEDVFDALGLGEDVAYEGSGGGGGSRVGFLHPGKSAIVYAMGQQVGYLGELHPALQQEPGLSRNVYLFELDLERLTALEKRVPRGFVPLPKYPSLRRDLALVVDEGMVVGDILREIGRVKSPYVESAQVFDVFTGDAIERGKKSVAVALVLRASDRTLTDEEASAVQDKILVRLREVLGTELRKT